MSTELYSIQQITPFSESLIWQINRDFYQQQGIAAWSDDIVPHQITNSSLVANTYADLIFAFLKDLESSGKSDDVVYILELGAGHGRLSYNIIEHLDQLMAIDGLSSIKYCYVLSDIVEDNLAFYSSHPKLQEYYQRGVLDIAYFDAVGSQELNLQKSNNVISIGDLEQPILAIANYFFDSLPNELFYFENRKVFDCSASVDSKVDPTGKNPQDLISEMQLTYHKRQVQQPYSDDTALNTILTQYSEMLTDTYILLPTIAIDCLTNISALSKEGLMLLTMDKGYKIIQELAGRKKPDFVTHGSFSLWVNFHAISQYCELNGGTSMFDHNTNQSIDLGCVNFIKDSSDFSNLEEAYRKYSSQMNLDDINSFKKLVYKNLATINLTELLGLIRINAYDSTIFINLLPSIKHLSKEISVKQRTRLKETIAQVWSKYYAIKKDYDLSYELGGLLYDLGYYSEALEYFGYSTDAFGYQIDVDYNSILCHYQLRQDKLFYEGLNAAKLRFPDSDAFVALDGLDMG